MKTRKLYILLTALLTLNTLSAQEREEAYYPYPSEREEFLPFVESDTTLFYRAVQQPRDHYEELTRYAFGHIAVARRGEPFYKMRWELDGLEVEYRNYASLRALGLTTRGEGLRSERDLMPTAHRISIRGSQEGYNLGVRYQGNLHLKSDWQVGLYADGRIGRDLFVHGVGSRSLRMALHAERRFSERWRWSLTGSCTPSWEARGGNSTQECFDLVGSSYYNPSWGFDNGRERSARTRREWLPMVESRLEYNATEQTCIALTALIEGGERRQGGLGWFDATTPLPDNYRKLPSYFADTSTSEAVAARWREHDSRYTQIDWQQMRTENRLSEDGARYVEQEEVERLMQLGVGLEARSRIGRGLTLRYGGHYRMARSRNFLELKDLLGAEWLLDIDYYLIDDDTFFNSLENDLRHPSRRVVEGDRFGYDYTLIQQRWSLYGDAEYHHDRWHLDLGARIEGVRIFREGHFEKELFAGRGSYGRSRTIHQSPYRITLSAGYALTPRHYIGLRGLAAGGTPEAEQLFLQSEYNNRTIDNPTLEHLYEAELVWRSSGRIVSWSATLFLRLRRGGVETDHLYDDRSGLFCDRVTSRISERYMGFEGAATCYLSRQWRLNFALSLVEASYADNPLITLYADTDNRMVASRMESYMGDCRPGGVPALSTLGEVSYSGKGWGADMECSYAALRYAHPDFQRRTLRTLQTSNSPEGFGRFMEQERLHDALRLNLSAWKSFAIHDYRLTLYLRIENLLGDDQTPYNSYEQGRIRRTYVGGSYRWEPFENRLSYAAPRTIYLSASFRF